MIMELDLLRSGDEAAFEALVRACEKKVYLLALRYTNNPADAMDISQDTFVKAFRNLKKFKGDSSPETWVYRIAVNTALDHVRRSARRSETGLYRQDEDGQEQLLDIPDERYSPEKAAEQTDMRELLQKAIAMLPEEQRQVIVLRDIDDFSYQQIAEILDVSEGTVKSRLFRARAKLLELLQNSGNFSSYFSSNKTRGAEHLPPQRGTSR